MSETFSSGSPSGSPNGDVRYWMVLDIGRFLQVAAAAALINEVKGGGGSGFTKRYEN